MKRFKISKSVFRNVHKIAYAAGEVSSSKISNTTYVSQTPELFYNTKQLDLQRVFARIIESEINPFGSRWERNEEFPSHEIFKRLGNAGLLGVSKPIEFGGLGLDFKFQAAVLEESGKIESGGVGLAFIIQTEVCMPTLNAYGSQQLKKQFLEPSIRGDFVACLGVSEPCAGSDVAAIKTTAVQKGDDLVINGQKKWVTNGLKADWMCLLAKTSDDKKPHANKSLICVPLNLPGIHKTKMFKLGLNASDTACVNFENVRVPVGNMIGEEGQGFVYQMQQFQNERLAGCLGTLKALDRIISQTIYHKSFGLGGVSVLDEQAVHFRLAELATEVEALRAMVYRAVDSVLKGQDVTRLACMAKLKGGRINREVSDACMRFWGEDAHLRDSPVTRFFRDARFASIGAGTDEMMIGIICKLMGTLPKPAKK